LSDAGEAPSSPSAIVAAIEAEGRVARTPFDGGDTVWRIWGDGPPLVLLHGGHGSWTHWVRNVLPLARRFTVLGPDMPGYGDSDLPAGEMDADRLAEILVSGLVRLVGERQPVALAGFSFGGVVAGHVAAVSRHPVRRVVLVGAGGFGLPRPPPPVLVKWQRETTEEGRRAAHRANLGAVMIADPGKVDDLAIHLQAENTCRARFRSRSVSLTNALLQRLEAARPPLGGIWGELDTMTGSYVGMRRDLLARLDPGSPFEIVPGAGHWVPYEASEIVNASLIDWLT
jgi:pimeloyl-ACP methyl ester carboxylesterase